MIKTKHRSCAKLALRAAGLALTAAWICIQSPASTALAATLTAQQITQFKADPAAALARFPNGGPELVSFIRDLVLTDGATLNSIMALIPTTTGDQQTAIGTGLGQAAQALVRTNPALGNQIHMLLVACGSGVCANAVLAYGAVIGNTVVGTGAAGGGGGAGSGPTVNGPPAGGVNTGTVPAGPTFLSTPGSTFPGGPR